MLLSVCKDYESMRSLDWEYIFGQVCHRTGGLDLRLWRDAVVEAQSTTFDRFGGSDRYQFSLTAPEMLSLSDNDEFDKIMPAAAFLFIQNNRHAIEKLRQAADKSDLPEEFTTNRMGRSTLSKALGKTILQMSDSHHPLFSASMAKDLASLTEAAAKRVKLQKNGSSDPYVVTLSINPGDITKMGYTSIDHNSCFAAGGQGNNIPTALAQTPGGFILFVHKKKTPWKLEGRAWGVLYPDAIYITNWYPNTKCAFLSITPKLAAIVARHFGYQNKIVRSPDLAANTDSTVPYGRGEAFVLETGRPYSNKDGAYFTATKTMGPRIVEIDSRGLSAQAIGGSYTTDTGPHSTNGHHRAEGGYTPSPGGMSMVRTMMYNSRLAYDTLPDAEKPKFFRLVGDRGRMFTENFAVPRSLVEFLHMAQISDTEVALNKNVMYDEDSNSVVLKEAVGSASAS